MLTRSYFVSCGLRVTYRVVTCLLKYGTNFTKSSDGTKYKASNSTARRVKGAIVKNSRLSTTRQLDKRREDKNLNGVIMSEITWFGHRSIVSPCRWRCFILGHIWSINCMISSSTQQKSDRSNSLKDFSWYMSFHIFGDTNASLILSCSGISCRIFTRISVGNCVRVWKQKLNLSLRLISMISMLISSPVCFI